MKDLLNLLIFLVTLIGTFIILWSVSTRDLASSISQLLINYQTQIECKIHPLGDEC